MDVHLTKDGQVVIIHDELLDRTTDHKGLVMDFTLAELKAMDASAGYEGVYGKNEIPTLDEYLDYVKEKPIITNIELKTGIIPYPGIEKKTLELIDQYHLRDKIIISSFNHYSVLRMKELAPDMKYGLLEDSRIVGMADYAKRLGVNYLHPLFYTIDEQYLREASADALGINAWTVNSEDDIRKMVQIGIHGIIGNNPDVCRKVLQEEAEKQGKYYVPSDAGFAKASGKHAPVGAVAEKGAEYSAERQGSKAAGADYRTEGNTARSKKGTFHVWTSAERDALPDDRRTELIDGVLYDMASPVPIHQDIARLICRQIDNCIEFHHASCHAFLAPMDVYLNRDQYTVVQPDLLVVCDPEQVGPKNIQGAPAFILEVLSPSTRDKDQFKKLYKYADAGVQEYWMIDPEARQVVIYDMTDSAGEEGASPKKLHKNEFSIYGFQDRIPLRISKGKCIIDMNTIREYLDRWYG